MNAILTKILGFSVICTCDLAMPVRHSNLLSYESTGEGPTDLLWVQMASFGSFNQLSYDRKQQVVETGHLNPEMASTTICNYVAQLVRVALELLRP